MTVSADYKPLVYIANGITTNFVITWSFFDKEVRVVNENGVNLTGYSIYNSGRGGAIIFNEAPKSGKIVILRDVKYNQSIEFNEGENFPAEDYEYSLDRIYMALQELGYEISRCLSLPEKYRDFEDFDNTIVRVRYNKSSLSAPFDWDSSISYDVHDICVFNGGLYINTLPANKGTAPSSSTSGWVKLATSSYTSTEIDTKLDNKANKSDVYTKEQVNTRLDLKADEIDLKNKADKEDVYTKAEVDSKIGDIDSVLDSINGEKI